MPHFKKHHKAACYLAVFFFVLLTAAALRAQTLPGSADPSRIQPLKPPVISEQSLQKIPIPEIYPDIAIPDASKRVSFHLSAVEIKGASAFTKEELADIYSPYLHREVTLDIVWMIAGQITERYQHEGFFLSRAYVPAQEIAHGSVVIEVVEGYVAEVALDDPLADYSFVQRLMKQLTKKRPVSAYDLESFTLQMNEIAGVKFRSFIASVENAPAGVTKLTLQPEKQAATRSVSFDNFGSRFLGPYQATVTYQDSFVPLQQTTISALSSLPTDELKYLALRHEIPLYPDLRLEFSGSYVMAAPGASLEVNDIRTASSQIGMGLFWQPLRLRQENLAFSLELDAKNTDGDILHNNPLTRDRTRIIRGGIQYDASDRWGGYHLSKVTISRGLDILGSSQAGDLNLSRAEASPDFTKAQLTHTRQQAIGDNFLVIGQFSGQFASDPLFSSEEFGYGGQSFGRAYDPSEITGDHGIAGSIEVRYLGLGAWHKISFTPYGYYDIGQVWNEDAGGISESASSAGFGVRLRYTSGFSGNLGVAWPLTRGVSTPIYGDGYDPRFLLQLSRHF